MSKFPINICVFFKFVNFNLAHKCTFFSGPGLIRQKKIALAINPDHIKLIVNIVPNNTSPR